jgi:hypothetical protein
VFDPEPLAALDGEPLSNIVNGVSPERQDRHRCKSRSSPTNSATRRVNTLRNSVNSSEA